MALRNVRAAAGDVEIQVDLELPDGVVVGLTGLHAGALQLFVDAVSGAVGPAEGSVERGSCFVASGTFHSAEPAAIEWWTEAALASDAHLVALGPSLALTDPLFRAWTQTEIERLRRAGKLVLVASQDLPFLERVADEVIVLEGGAVAERGDPSEAVRAYRERVVQELRASTEAPEVDDSQRHGDRKCELVDLALTGADGAPASTVRSGEAVAASVRIRFRERVEDPVVGVLIRNRVGVCVYGTNTELEGLRFGPCEAGEEIEAVFAFDCDLCPHEYTLTAACHDPDGTAHDWLEEALLFTVADDRYTAGVANLRAEVRVERV